MNFQPTTKNDLKTVIGWIPDARTCSLWAGPKVIFPLKLEQLCDVIEFDTIYNYSLIDENVLLAFGQIRMFENKRGHLSRIIVNPGYREKGIGEIFCSGLINKAKQLKCKTISLNVDKENKVAKSLYKKLGFIVPPIQPDSLRETVVYMELTLNK